MLGEDVYLDHGSKCLNRSVYVLIVPLEQAITLQTRKMTGEKNTSMI